MFSSGATFYGREQENTAATSSPLPDTSRYFSNYPASHNCP